MSGLPEWIEKFPLLEQDEPIREALAIAWRTLDLIAMCSESHTDILHAKDALRRIEEVGK